MKGKTAAEPLAHRRALDLTAADLPKDYSMLPYDTVKTPQVKGRVDEARMAKERGARLHPMSGAGSIKDDFSTEDTIFEVKSVKKTHTLNGADLLALFRRGTQQGKGVEYVIEFADAKLEATVTLRRLRNG
jgi:hypothetical protein